jgi:Cytochrome P450
VSALINTRWALRRQEEEERVRSAAAAAAGGGRSEDILDKVLAVYEKQLQEELEQQQRQLHTQQKQRDVSTSTTTGNSSSRIHSLPMTLPPSVVRQFRDEMKTFMLAGHETSAAMMTWAFYEMLGQDDLQQAVRREGCSVFGAARTTDIVDMSSDDLPSSENLAHLVLSQACLLESLRKYSVVPIVARRTVQDVYLPKHQQDESSNGNNNPTSRQTEEEYYFIPKGSSFLINIQAVHHDPRYWPEPMKFDPHRFLSRPQDSNSNSHHQQQNGHDTNGGDNHANHGLQQQQHEPFTFLPFIAGPRNCLGQHLALLESKMVLAMLTQRYSFSLPKNVKVELHDWASTTDQDPRHRFMVPVVPKQELLVHISRNSNSSP